jgi:hypothetical protein
MASATYEARYILKNQTDGHTIVMKGFMNNDKEFHVATVDIKNSSGVKIEKCFPFKVGHKYTESSLDDHAVNYDYELVKTYKDSKEIMNDESSVSA